MPARILSVTKLVVKKFFLFFSIDLLFKTLFQPWKRDEIDTTNMSLQDKARVLMMNLISRLVGAIVRGGTILIGLLAVAAAFLLGICAAIVIVGLPAIAIVLLVITLL